MTDNDRKAMFSSKSDQWATPQDLFDELNKEFFFDLDPCADESNHKCEQYFTEQDDGLKKSWGGAEYSAIHHIARLAIGCVKHITNRSRIILLSAC